jgi:hypothetical protein
MSVIPSNSIIASHSPRRVEGNRWVAQVDLERHDSGGEGLWDNIYWDPNLNLTFASKEEANARDFEIARGWVARNAPGARLFWRRADDCDPPTNSLDRR